MKGRYYKIFKLFSTQGKYVNIRPTLIGWIAPRRRGKPSTSRVDVGMRAIQCRLRGYMEGNVSPWKDSAAVAEGWVACGAQACRQTPVWRRLFSVQLHSERDTSRATAPTSEARDISWKTKWNPSLSFIAQVSSKPEHLKTHQTHYYIHTHVDVQNMSPLHCRQWVTVKKARRRRLANTVASGIYFFFFFITVSYILYHYSFLG